MKLTSTQLMLQCGTLTWDALAVGVEEGEGATVRALHSEDARANQTQTSFCSHEQDLLEVATTQTAPADRQDSLQTTQVCIKVLNCTEKYQEKYSRTGGCYVFQINKVIGKPCFEVVNSVNLEGIEKDSITGYRN